jgi:hypothetical protein
VSSSGPWLLRAAATSRVTTFPLVSLSSFANASISATVLEVILAVIGVVVSLPLLERMYTTLQGVCDRLPLSAPGRRPQLPAGSGCLRIPANPLESPRLGQKPVKERRTPRVGRIGQGGRCQRLQRPHSGFWRERRSDSPCAADEQGDSAIPGGASSAAGVGNASGPCRQHYVPRTDRHDPVEAMMCPPAGRPCPATCLRSRRGIARRAGSGRGHWHRDLLG